MLDPMDLCKHGPVIPVIVIDRLEDAVPLAQALLAGGVRVLEVTLRTPVALRAIAAIAREVPHALVGAGTLRSPADVQAAHQAGACFGVSPGYTPSLGAACRAIGLPLLPGVATASEIMVAHGDGWPLLKFFPAMAAGGLGLLKAWAGPFPEVAFCPTGGLTPDNAPEFLALPNVRVCGGSWLTPEPLVRAADWPGITRRARKACALRAP